MNNVVLQIPMNADLRSQSLSVAQDMGFSSLQELVRVFLTKLSKKQVSLTIDNSITLSEKAIKRYEKMSEDFDNGVNITTAHSVEELMRQLHED